MDDHLPQAVVAELQQEDLPSPAILLKSNAPRDLLHLDVVNEQSTGNNDVSPKPVAKRIMKRKESRGKRSSSQSSSRGVTPDPGHKRFNPRTDGLAAFYQCLLRLFNQSSDGTILWNDLRTVYRKETTRHLNSEELNLISGTHGRTKNDLLATRLSCLIEPLDSKGQIVRLAVNSDGSPVPLPSPMTSDDDSSSTRQSLSRLASIDDEEQQRIIMDEKRREITEGLIRRGLLNPDGSRSTIITEKADEEYADLPELVADAANSVVDDVMEKTAEEKSITQCKMTNDEKDPILEGLPSAKGIAQVVKMVEGVEPVTTETSLLNNDVKQVTAGVVEMRDEAIGEIQAKASEIKIDAPTTVEVSEKKLSIVNVPSIEITQYSDNEADTEEIEEKTASEIAEELVASVLADSVDSMKDDLVVKDEEELVSDVHAVLDNISDTTVSSPEDGPVKRVYTLEETAHYLLDSDFDSESEKERRRAMNFPMEKTEDEEGNGLHAEQAPVHEISGSDSKIEVREHNVLYTDEEEAEQMVPVAEKSKSIEETTEVENKVEIPAYIETEITAGDAEKTEVTEDQRHDGDLSVKQDTANSEAVQSVENSYHEEKKVEEKTSETENGEETEVPAKLITQENDAVVEEDQTAAQNESQSIPVAAPRSFTKPVVLADEIAQEKITEQTKTPDVINLVVEDRPESPSQPSAMSTDSVVTVEEAIHEPVISSSESETAVPQTVKVEAVIEEKKPEFVPHSVTKTVTFEVLEQRNEKTVTFVSQTMVNSEASSTFDKTEVKEEVVPTPVYRTESGGTVTLEVELKKLNEEYEELMDMLENKPHASTSQELPPPKTNKVADVVVTLTPSQDLEKRDYVAQPADQPKKKKEKKRHGLFGCCSFF